jgi:hypothetical protein
MSWSVYSNVIARGGEVKFGREPDDRDQRRAPAGRSVKVAGPVNRDCTRFPRFILIGDEK